MSRNLYGYDYKTFIVIGKARLLSEWHSAIYVAESRAEFK